MAILKYSCRRLAVGQATICYLVFFFFLCYLTKTKQANKQKTTARLSKSMLFHHQNGNNSKKNNILAFILISQRDFYKCRTVILIHTFGHSTCELKTRISKYSNTYLCPFPVDWTSGTFKVLMYIEGDKAKHFLDC